MSIPSGTFHHLALRDPRDGRTMRFSVYLEPGAMAGEFVLAGDGGDEADGWSLLERFPNEASLGTRLIELLAAYRLRGYQPLTESMGQGTLARPVGAKPN
jgi:hypothetical protein